MKPFNAYYLKHKNTLQRLERSLQDYTKRYLQPFKPSKISLAPERQINPFLIIGSGRSGTTLLRRICSSHPDLVIPPENYSLSSAVSTWRRYGNLAWKEFIGVFYSTFEYQKDYETYGLGSLQELVLEARSWGKERQSVAELVDAFYKHYLGEHKPSAKRWGDKTPLNTMYLPEMNRVFPDAQYIHMTRDPYDVVASYVKAGLSPDVKHAAKRWSVAVNAARKFGDRYANRYLEVAYEELVKSPTETTQKICDFLEVDYIEGMEHDLNHRLGDVEKHAHHNMVLRKISDESIGRGRREMSKHDIDAINRIIASTAD